MTANEAFKLGFLTRCVEEGMTPEQIHTLTKRAFSSVTQNVTDAAKAPFDISASALSTGQKALPYLAAAMAIPPSVGGLMAYLKNHATDRGDDLVEEAKQQELTDTYQRMAEQLQRAQQMRKYKQQRKRTGQVYL
jgi:enoyl-CoA hydratase/carnithine racemase